MTPTTAVLDGPTRTGPTSVPVDATVDGRAAGRTLIAGAVVMVSGAIAYFSAGADLWAGVDDGEMTTYLAAAAEHTTVLYLSCTLWSVGALLLGLGGSLAARRAGNVAAGNAAAGNAAASTVYAVGSALAVVSFVVMASVVRLASSGGGVEIADALGFVGIRLDDLATVLLIALGPALLAWRGRATWMPTWLAVWAAVAAVAGLLSVLAIFTGEVSTYGMLVVPIGLAWTVAAGTVLVREPR